MRETIGGTVLIFSPMFFFDAYGNRMDATYDTALACAIGLGFAIIGLALYMFKR
jgi:hypothetical protein